MDSYYEENNQLGALQTAVNSAPENPLHYLKFFDYLKSSDSSEVSYFIVFYALSISLIR
jgi:hypothetical protein